MQNIPLPNSELNKSNAQKPLVSNSQNLHRLGPKTPRRAFSLEPVRNSCHCCGGHVSKLAPLPQNSVNVNVQNPRGPYPLASRRENTPAGPHHDSHMEYSNIGNFDVRMRQTEVPQSWGLGNPPISYRSDQLMQDVSSGTIIAPGPYHWYRTVDGNFVNLALPQGVQSFDNTMGTRGRDINQRVLDTSGLRHDSQMESGMGNFYVERRGTSMAPLTQSGMGNFYVARGETSTMPLNPGLQFGNSPRPFIGDAGMGFSHGPSVRNVQYRSPTRSRSPSSMAGWRNLPPSPTPAPGPSTYNREREERRVSFATFDNAVHPTPESYSRHGTPLVVPEEPAPGKDIERGRTPKRRKILASDPLNRAPARAIVRSQAILDKYIPGRVCTLCNQPKAALGGGAARLLEHLISLHFVQPVKNMTEYNTTHLDIYAKTRGHFIQNEEQYQYTREYVNAVKCSLCDWGDTCLVFRDQHIKTHLKKMHPNLDQAEHERELKRVQNLIPPSNEFYNLQDKFLYNFPFIIDKGKGKEKEIEDEIDDMIGNMIEDMPGWTSVIE